MKYLNVRILSAVFITLALTILPCPSWLSMFRPSWVLLLILYLEFFLQPYFSILFVFILGISLDVLMATFLGQHIFALLLTTWIASNFSRRFCFFPIGQQMMLIGLFSIIYQFVFGLNDAFLGYNFSLLKVVLSSLISVLLWPWIRIIADGALFDKFGGYAKP